MIGTWVNDNSCWLIPENPIAIFIDDKFFEICNIHLGFSG
jgi:hypothetical protein